VPRPETSLAADFLRATGLLGARVRVVVGETEHEGVIEDLSVADGLRLRNGGANVLRFPLEVVRAVSRSL
jgi:hypothetical protein